MSFPRLGRAVGESILKRVGRTASRVHEETPLAADLLESEDALLAVFDAPGAAVDDVQVDVGEDAIRVHVDRFREFHEGYEMRFPGRGLRLDGEVDLPGDAAVDPEAARAELRDDGTLYVFVPKIDAT